MIRPDLRDFINRHKPIEKLNNNNNNNNNNIVPPRPGNTGLMSSRG